MQLNGIYPGNRGQQLFINAESTDPTVVADPVNLSFSLSFSPLSLFLFCLVFGFCLLSRSTQILCIVFLFPHTPLHFNQPLTSSTHIIHSPSPPQAVVYSSPGSTAELFLEVLDTSEPRTTPIRVSVTDSGAKNSGPMTTWIYFDAIVLDKRTLSFSFFFFLSSSLFSLFSLFFSFFGCSLV